MRWIIEEPVLYVMEKSWSSDAYVTMLGIATLPRKYALCAYLRLQAKTVEAADVRATKTLIKTVAKQIYTEGGIAVTAVPVSKENFGEYTATCHDRSWAAITLNTGDQAGRLQVSYLGNTRPVTNLSDTDLDNLLVDVRKRQEGIQVKWENRTKAEILPDVCSLGGSAVWG